MWLAALLSRQMKELALGFFIWFEWDKNYD